MFRFFKPQKFASFKQTNFLKNSLFLNYNQIKFTHKKEMSAAATTTTTTGIEMADSKNVLETVKEYYGKTLQKTGDLKTSCCMTCGEKPTPEMLEAINKVPDAVNEKFYGCGFPLLDPENMKGKTVVDLGCGSGRDIYVAAQLAGKQGKCYGIDMTEEQLSVAKAAEKEFRATNPEAAETVFLQGYIEDIESAGVPKNSVDLVISNCVINLSPNKRAVLQHVFKCLKNGGEFLFSDIYVDRRLSEEVRSHKILLGECFSGALAVSDFLQLAKEIGFTTPIAVKPAKIVEIDDPELKKVPGVEEATFYSITFSLTKFENFEDFSLIAKYYGLANSKNKKEIGGDECCGGDNKNSDCCGGGDTNASAAASSSSCCSGEQKKSCCG